MVDLSYTFHTTLCLLLYTHTLGSSYLHKPDNGAEDEQAYWSYEDADKGGGTTEEASSFKHTPVSGHLYHTLSISYAQA